MLTLKRKSQCIVNDCYAIRITLYLHKIRRVLMARIKGGLTVLSTLTYVRGHRNSSVKKVRVNKQPGRSLNSIYL